MEPKNSKPPSIAVGRLARAAPSLLVEKLTARMGDARAHAMVSGALTRSGRPEVPEHLDDLIAFTKAHLMEDLVRALGARVVSEFLDELTDAARLASGVRLSSGEGDVTVALLDRDVFRRASTARQLIARKIFVVVLQQLEDLLTEALEPDVVLLEEEDALSPALSRVVAERDVSIVVRANDPAASTLALKTAGVRVFETTTSNTPSDLVATIDRALQRRG